MEPEKSELKSKFDKFRHSNRLAVFIVFSTVMLDSILLTCIVPILPEYFFHEDAKEFQMMEAGLDVETSTRSIVTKTTEAQTTKNTEVTKNVSVAGSECVESANKNYLESQNLFLALLLASKPFVQGIANIAVGPISDRIGYDIPMFAGYIVLILSSLIFAFGKSYAVLFFARSLQGIGSACASTAGFAMLASRFEDDEERGKMLGMALSGLALGVLIGPTFGSVTYAIAGKETPFLILAALSFVIGFLQLCSRQLQMANHDKKSHKTSSMFKMLKDPYILIAGCAIVLGNVGIGVMETGLPMWMMVTMCAKKWMLGVATLPASISYLVMTAVTSRIGGVDKRWIICLIAYFIGAISAVLYPQCKSLWQLMGPGVLLGSSVAMVDATVLPILGTLADLRHASIYGSIYAIADASFCVAFIIGPLLAGALIRFIGYTWLMYIVAILNVLFAPFVCFLRNPPPIEEERAAIIDNEIGNDTVTYDPQLSTVGRVMNKHETE